MQVCYNTNAVFEKQVKCCNCGFLALYYISSPQLPKSLKTMQDIQAAKELGLFGSHECTQRGREQIAKSKHSHLTNLSCEKNVWVAVDFQDKPTDDFFQFLNSNRKCPYFFPYNPGYSPVEHRELQREAKYQRLLIIGMLLAALIGAVAAIVAQVLAR